MTAQLLQLAHPRRNKRVRRSGLLLCAVQLLDVFAVDNMRGCGLRGSKAASSEKSRHVAGLDVRSFVAGHSIVQSIETCCLKVLASAYGRCYKRSNRCDCTSASKQLIDDDLRRQLLSVPQLSERVGWHVAWSQVRCCTRLFAHGSPGSAERQVLPALGDVPTSDNPNDSNVDLYPSCAEST
jgi:hypothetical protein